MKYFFSILILGMGYILWNLNPKVPAHYDSPIYKELCKTDFGPFDREKTLNISIGIDYLPYELIEIFEEITGVKVMVDIFDSNEILEAKLLAGGTQYDIVFPTAWPNFSRQLEAKLYRQIDRNRLDYSQFNPILIEKLAIYNDGDKYCIPYQFGISGIGLDEKLFEKVLPGVDKCDLAIFLDPKNAEKLAKVRISVYDSAEELFPMVLCYLGLDPESNNEEDIIKAAEHLKKIRKYIYKFTSYGFEDLSSQNVAMGLGTSGDIIKAGQENPKASIKFFRPKQGTALWIDVMAIPVNSRHVKNAYAFFKFLLHPLVISEVTNQTSRANCVPAANKFVDSEIVDDENIYPSDDFIKQCYVERPVSANVSALRTRLLTKIKSIKE